jgi:hypothetical protein
VPPLDRNTIYVKTYFTVEIKTEELTKRVQKVLPIFALVSRNLATSTTNIRVGIKSFP